MKDCFKQVCSYQCTRVLHVGGMSGTLKCNIGWSLIHHEEFC